MWLVPTADGNWLRFTMDNKHLASWDGQSFTPMKVTVADALGKREIPVQADRLLPTTEGLVASFNNKVKALVELNGNNQVIDEEGIVHTSAGRKLGWDKEAQVWREGFTIQDGHLMRWEKGAYVIYGTTRTVQSGSR